MVDTGQRPAPEPAPLNLPELLGRQATVFAVYAFAALAAMLMAPPDQLWPPLNVAAGVGLACVLGWGAAMLPAVGLAAAVCWLVFHGWSPDAGVAEGLAAVAVGSGAALQAGLAAWLVRRFVARPLLLERPADIARFLLLAGPVAALACAPAVVAGLVAAGGVPRGQAPLHTLNWWTGDTLGVLVGAPMMLPFVARPAAAWSRRRLTVGLPMLVVTLVLGAAIARVQAWDDQRQHSGFARDAAATASGMQLRLQAYVDALTALHGVYMASQEVSRAEFARAAEPWLGSLPGVQALGWHEWVPRSDLPAFIARQQADGLPDFHVIERDPALSAADPSLLLMRFVEPLARNRAALGVNVLAVAQAREAALRAREANEPVATAGFQLDQDIGGQLGVVVYRAVGTGPGRPGGIVFVTLRIGDVLSAALADKPGYLAACLTDISAGHTTALAGGAECHKTPQGTGARSLVEMDYRVTLPFAGRHWELRLWPRGPLPLSGERYNTYLFNAGGVMLAAALGALLLVMTGRTRQVEEAVAERTEQLQAEVAERARTEEALRDSEQRFRAIFDNVPLGVLHADMRGRIRQTNPALAEMAGRPGPTLGGAPLSELVHPDDRLVCEELLATVVRAGPGGAASAMREMRFAAGEGAQRVVRMHLRRLDDGENSGIVGVLEDVTQRKRLLEAERARELAEAANRAKTEFLSRMSHELRTPLNAMLGFAQLMRMDPQGSLSGDQRERVDQIEQAGWHLLEMINDVLDLSRIESGTLKLAMQTLSVREAVEAARVLVEPMARRHDVQVNLSGVQADAYVLGDPTRLRQVLTNLLTNAVKYNRAHGTVTVSTRAVGEGDWTIEVADTGLGMSAEQVAALFQPFNRLGRDRTGTEGTGIGLVISLRLAEMMGGTLNASSHEGEGSTFALKLPRAATSPPPRPAGALAAGAPGYHRRRVVYIEDNAINAEVMRGILRQRPQIVLEIYTNGRDGLQAVREEPPSLLLLDMHLPDMHGCEVLERLQTQLGVPLVPVVVVSADAVSDQVDRALSLGAMRYLTKPVDVAELLAAVDSVLDAETTVW